MQRMLLRNNLNEQTNWYDTMTADPLPHTASPAATSIRPLTKRGPIPAQARKDLFDRRDSSFFRPVPSPVRAWRAVTAAATVALFAVAAPAAGAQAESAQDQPSTTQPTWTRTIYVDHEHGDNAAAGATPETSRKTVPARDELEPGVRVLFKGGVRYPAPIRITSSGTDRHPVVFDGNADGEWGEGRAILDGAGLLGPWRETGKTPKGLTIWETDLPNNFKWDHQYFHIWQDGEPLRIASSANLEDNLMIAEDGKYWHGQMQKKDKGVLIRDPKNFGDLKDGWEHTAIWYYGNNNHTYRAKAIGFDRASSSLRFKQIQMGGGKLTYALLNHPDVLDAPGEYLVRPDKKTVRLITIDNADPGAAALRYSRSSVGIANPTSSHIIIRGFHITGTLGDSVRIGKRGGRGRATHVHVEDFEAVGSGAVRAVTASDVTIEHGNLYEITGFRPIFIDRCDRVRVAWNRLRRSQSGITGFGAVNSLFLGNDVRETLNIHGNAMTIYVGSHNTWLIGNTLVGGRAGIGLALRNSNDLIIAFNTIRGGKALCQWMDPKGGSPMTICNNTILGSFLLRLTSIRKIELYNNFIANYHRVFKTEDLRVHSHNIYERVYEPMLGDETNRIRKRRELFTWKPIGHPKPEAWEEILAKGRKDRPSIVPGGLEVNTIGARDKDGELPDLKRVIMPASQSVSEKGDNE